jgi:hypothetical protein
MYDNNYDCGCDIVFMHCKDISIMEADFPLTEDDIRKGLVGHKAYVRAQYSVLSRNGQYAVVRQHLSDGTGLFRTVESIDIISLPETTVFVEMPGADVLNIPDSAQIQKEYPGKTIVVQGMFSHISFVTGVQWKTLRVVDSVPPHPSKTEILVNKALESGYIDIPIVTEFLIIDIRDMLSKVKTEAVVFPCRVSGLKTDIPYYFLDCNPEIKHEVTLLGCSTSNRIFKELYGRDPPSINTCPKDFCPTDGVKTIVRCCRIKQGHIIEGDIAMVSWGATVPEVVEAIKALFA